MCLSVFEEGQAEELNFKIYLSYGHFPSLPAMVKKKKKSCVSEIPSFRRHCSEAESSRLLIKHREAMTDSLLIPLQPLQITNCCLTLRPYLPLLN